jgi:hypothetical protein
MQQKAIEFSKESAAKERDALKAASASVNIATVTTTTTVLKTIATPSVQSQQSTSSVVTVVAAENTPLMAGQIFCDFLISTRSKKLPIHERMKKIASHTAHEYKMNFGVKDTLLLVPFNGGTPHEWTRANKTKGRVSPISVQRYTQRASDLVNTSLGGANVMVRD